MKVYHLAPYSTEKFVASFDTCNVSLKEHDHEDRSAIGLEGDKPGFAVLYDGYDGDEPNMPWMEAGKDFGGLLVDFDGLDVKKDFYLNPVSVKVCRLNGNYWPDPDIWDVVVINPVDMADPRPAQFRSYSPAKLEWVAKAMYSGAVVIAPPLSIFENIVVNGVTGFFYKDQKEKESLVRQMSDDPLLRMEISEAAHNWMVDTADIRLLAGRLEELCR